MILGLKNCYRWMLITFYSGQKPKEGRNSWNKNDLTEMDAAVGLTNYEHDPKTGKSTRKNPSKGRDSYAYPPLTKFTIYRGKKGKDSRTVRDGGSGWAYSRKGAPNGVAVDEWLDLWTPNNAEALKKGTEVDLVSTEVQDDCPCPDGWFDNKNITIPEHLQKIKDAI
ncbi:hypothetical protein [Victivallis sp. Marseille-Q1083]|uniref:hypothetical protein n=1 Tax=Victivallis sp. Marseille-Q1083 TaxID=2717288 RepID=UPI00158A815C|nr:hypothetical protein [Victivallis sp. Marseille-Q1083]